MSAERIAELEAEVARLTRALSEAERCLAAEMEGAAAIRKKHGARDDETFFAFVDRLAAQGPYAELLAEDLRVVAEEMRMRGFPTVAATITERLARHRASCLQEGTRQTKGPPEGDASKRALAPIAIPDSLAGGVSESLGQGASPPVRPNSDDPIIDAQHDETGRMWSGPRSQLPPRFAEVEAKCSPTLTLCPRCNNDVFECDGLFSLNVAPSQGNTDAARWRWCVAHPYEAMLVLMEATNPDSYPDWAGRGEVDIERVRNYFVEGVDEWHLRGPEEADKKVGNGHQTGASPPHSFLDVGDGVDACGTCGDEREADVHEISATPLNSLSSSGDSAQYSERELYEIARDFRDTLCRVLDTAERRTKAGKPLEQDEIDAMTARLVETTKRLDDLGRPPKHYNDNRVALQGAFHWKNGLYFYRMPDGAVRVVHDDILMGSDIGPNMLAPEGTQSNHLDVIIPRAEWESIERAVGDVHSAGNTPDSDCPGCGSYGAHYPDCTAPTVLNPPMYGDVEKMLRRRGERMGVMKGGQYYIKAADTISEMRVALASQIEISNDLRRQLETRNKDVAELVGVFQHRRQIGGYDVPVANVPYTLVSDAGHLMCQGEPFAACYWDTPHGRTFGLRSTDDGVDVGEIAKLYGGGGHRNASGFKVPYTHPLGGGPAQRVPGPEKPPRPANHHPVA